LFVWQLPHFIAISLYRADEYGNAGLKVVPIVHGLDGAKLRIALYSLLMMVVSLAVLHTQLASPLYLAAALMLGGGMVTLSAYGLQKECGARWARWYFLYTLIYLPGLLGALAAGAHRLGAGPIL
jgi:heme o synthase